MPLFLPLQFLLMLMLNTGVPQMEYQTAALRHVQAAVAPTPVEAECALRSFDWMGRANGLRPRGWNTPFLLNNASGFTGEVAFLDVDRDGRPEVILSTVHPPRGIPTVQILKMQGNGLYPAGGFYEAHGQPCKLSYYRDGEGQLLILYETAAYYGGQFETLVATYIDTMETVPIAAVGSHYGQAGTERYYVFPSDSGILCNNDFLAGMFRVDDTLYLTDHADYEAACTNFRAGLTWVEDVDYTYVVRYNRNNYSYDTREIRFDEISETGKNGDIDYFQMPEEIKKTSDMVAEALIKAYRAQISEPTG